MTIKDMYVFFENCLYKSIYTDSINVDVMSERKLENNIIFYGYRITILCENLSFIIRQIPKEDLLKKLYKDEYQITSFINTDVPLIDKIENAIRDIKLKDILER